MSKLTENRLIFEKIARIREQQTAATEPRVKDKYQREIDRLAETITKMADIAEDEFHFLCR